MRCRSKCGAGCRAVSRSTRTTSTRSRAASDFLGLHFGRVMTPTDERAPRDQGAVELVDPRRARAALRHRHEPHSQRHRWQLGLQRRRPDSGTRARLRKRAPGRHEREGPAGHVLLPDHPRPESRQPGPAARDDAPRRRHPEHAQGLRDQPDSPCTGYSALGVPDGPLHRSGQQRELHSGQGRRLRAAIAPHPRAVLHAIRHRTHETVPVQRHRELRIPRSTC